MRISVNVLKNIGYILQKGESYGMKYVLINLKRLSWIIVTFSVTVFYLTL